MKISIMYKKSGGKLLKPTKRISSACESLLQMLFGQGVGYALAGIPAGIQIPAAKLGEQYVHKKHLGNSGSY